MKKIFGISVALTVAIMAMGIVGGCTKNPVQPTIHIPVTNGAWYALGSGIGPTFTLAFDNLGNIYTGGWYMEAKWNGSTWTTFNSGLVGGNSGLPSVSALACDNSGNLYAGEYWSGNNPYGYIIKWHGSTWSTIGTISNGFIDALVIDKSGNIYIGGQFDTVSGIFVNNIAKWNGSSWCALGGGLTSSEYPYVNALSIDSSGNLYACGAFSSAGGVSVNNIAKWNGISWSALGTGMGIGNWGNNSVYALVVDKSGNLYVGGSFGTAGSVTASYIAKWDGSSWSALGSGIRGVEYGMSVYALTIDSYNNLYAGGAFDTAGEVAAKNIAKWDGNTWSSIGTRINNGVNVLAIDNSGKLYAGGTFDTAGGIPANGIAVWK